jgi:hypothetical protein
MNNVCLSLYIEASYPANKLSIAKRKPVHGVGTNDAHYITTPMVNGAQLWDPAYRSWFNMLKRAYNPKFHATQPTYLDVTVCAEWLSFSAFRTWWIDNYQDCCHMDKDLLVIGNKEYSHDACVYVPRWLNSFLNDHRAARGDLPIGVHLHKRTGKFTSSCSNPITGTNVYLGLFDTKDAAHEAWLRCKLDIADQLKPEMDAIDTRIYRNVTTIIETTS